MNPEVPGVAQKTELLKESRSEFDLSYELDTSRDKVDLYIFNHVAVAIDRRGKNQNKYPELHFGTFDESPNNDMLNAPETPREDVTMEYIVACIKEAVAQDGSHEFYIHAHGKDGVSGKEELRAAARLKLYSKYVELVPYKDSDGYILKV